MERKYADQWEETAAARRGAHEWVKRQNETFEQTAAGRQLLEEFGPQFTELKEILKRIDACS